MKMKKSLTVKELKALQPNDWIWVEYADRKEYATIVYNNEEEIMLCFLRGLCCAKYSEYENFWIAYKNKELSESGG